MAFGGEPVSAKAEISDSLDVIFESVPDQNVAHVRRRAKSLSAAERYDFLTDWVLPSKTHRSMRLSVEFTPTNPVAPLVDDHPVDVRRRKTAERRGLRRVQTGGLLVSPCFDLIDAASELGRLDELRANVAAVPVRGEVSARRRLAMMALIDMARRDYEKAANSVGLLESQVAAHVFPEFQHRLPETTVICAAIEHPELHDLVEPFLIRILEGQVRRGQLNGPDPWDRAMNATLGRLRYLQRIPVDATEQANATSAHHRGDRDHFNMSPDIANWFPVTQGDSWTYGRGHPCSHWEIVDGVVENMASHQNEFLYFQSPLRGNFAVEFDATGFPWRECHPMFGGKWFEPFHTYHAFLIGDLRGQFRNVELDPPLSHLDQWMRYRIVVRNNVRRIFLNGRQLHESELSKDHNPWLAVRSPFQGFGKVRDMRITGQPEVPQRISLSDDESLSGWLSWTGELMGKTTEPEDERAGWKLVTTEDGENEIVCNRRDDLSGSYFESLLRYHRPMVEDGVIEYEFFHQPGEFMVHPAIDRRVFLLNHDGVAEHWVTNGRWNRTGLDPQNVVIAVSDKIPLTIGWNQMQVELNGDSLTLTLNGQRIHQCRLAPVNDRTFGLFHYTDQDRVRVRNVSWRGGWPSTVPPLHEQQLRATDIDELDAMRSTLAATFEHDFGSVPLSPGTFSFSTSDGKGTAEMRQREVVSTDSPDTQTLVPAGLLMNRPGSRIPHRVYVIPRIRIKGDFDIVASFEDLKLETPDKGDAQIALITVCEDDEKTHSRVWHGVWNHPDARRRRFSQVEINRFRQDRVQTDFTGRTTEACDSGRLRIARIGSRMYFMIAEHDSSSYRLLHSEDCPVAPVGPGGLRLTAGTQAGGKVLGSVSVVWKKLLIRADEIENLMR